MSLMSPCLSMFVYGSFVFICDLSMHEKCFNYALINLLFNLCKSMLIINMFVTHPNPHLEATTRPFTPEVLQPKEHTLTPCYFVIFTFILAFESIQKFGGASHMKFNIMKWMDIIERILVPYLVMNYKI
jgi:hypothetical protein